MFDPELIKHLIIQYGYLALFLGAIVEGFHVMLFAGFFSALHYLKLIPSFLAVSSGCFLADTIIFLIGYTGGKPILGWLGRHLSRLGHSLEPAKEYLHRYPARIFFIVKITTGFAIATILTAGASNMKPLKFLGWDLLANFFVASIMMTLGYFFGQSYLLIYNIFHYWALTFLAGFLIIFLIFNNYLTRKFTEKQNQKTSG